MSQASVLACGLAETNDANSAHRRTHWPPSPMPLRRDGSAHFLTPGPRPTVNRQVFAPAAGKRKRSPAAPAVVLSVLSILECTAAIAAAPPLPDRHTLELRAHVSILSPAPSPSGSDCRAFRY
ncbi:hypothetical protein ABW21_db0200574 [Orbilia brochopaga]|nr:hypothetical protein ABW21_db0200574 [Drechslerella brochopaga]